MKRIKVLHFSIALYPLAIRIYNLHAYNCIKSNIYIIYTYFKYVYVL